MPISLDFDDSDDAWEWWELVDSLGKVLSSSPKFQRERWHLHALHQSTTLDAITEAMLSRLTKRYSSVQLRIGSVWVDHTPQARSKFSAPPSRQVTCELADLLVVTHVNVLTMPNVMDTRAVLVQAKVTDIPGILDTESLKSSSAKERNLLERCCQSISIYSGTKAASGMKIGEYDLGANSSSLGLAAFAKYLTIPNSMDGHPIAPYQAMWPTSRTARSGTASSFGDMIFSMLDPGAVAPAGASLVTPPTPDWPRLVNDLTQTLSGSVVKRFLESTGGISRIHEGALRFGTNSASIDSTLRLFVKLQSGLNNMNRNAKVGGLGHFDKPPSAPDNSRIEFGDVPAIPVLMLHAVMDGPIDSERPNL